MEIELAQSVIDEIVYKTAFLVKKELLKELRSMAGQKEPEWVTTEEAARILKLSRLHMLKLKEFIPHVKSGAEGGPGHILWRRDKLLEGYAGSGDVRRRRRAEALRAEALRAEA